MTKKTTTINKDMFYAIVVLSISCMVSGTMMIVLGENALMITLGIIKLAVALAILPYTLKHKVGQRRVVAASPKKTYFDHLNSYESPNQEFIPEYGCSPKGYREYRE